MATPNPLSSFFEGFQGAQTQAQQARQQAAAAALNEQLKQIQIAAAQQQLLEATKTPQQRALDSLNERLAIAAAIPESGISLRPSALQPIAAPVENVPGFGNIPLPQPQALPESAVPVSDLFISSPNVREAATASKLAQDLKRIQAEAAARNTGAPRQIPTQLAGFGQVGEEDVALVFDPATGTMRSSSFPTGVTGVRPKTSKSPEKSLLLENKSTGEVMFSTLREGEKVPEGFKIKEKETSDFKNVQDLRKEVTANPVIKQFTEVAKSKQRIDAAIAEAATTNNFVAVDQALISSFNRLLEPDSVTMVSEYARTSADAPLINRIRANINRVTEGGRLTNEERAALSRMSDALYGTSLNNYNQAVSWYSNIAEKQGFDPQDIIQPLTGTPSGTITPPPSQLTPAAQEFLRKKPPTSP